jgi:hypothetical protein
MSGHRTTLTQHGVPIRLGTPAMKLHSFFAFAAVSLASLTVRPASAVAQGESLASLASLEYVAPTPDCVSNDGFQALVTAEIARFPSSDRDRRLSVRIVRQDGLYAGTLTTETGGVRTIKAAQCEDVTAALAVIISVAEPSGAGPDDTPPPRANKSAQVDLSQPSEPDREPAGSASRLEWRVGARGFLTSRPSSNFGGMGAVSLELPWGFGGMMFEVGGGMSTAVGGSPWADTYLILDTQICPLDLPIGSPESPELSVLPCLRVDGAEFRSAQVGGPLPPSGPQAFATHNGGAFWTGVSVRLRLQTSGGVFVEGNVDGMAGTVSAGEGGDTKQTWVAGGLGVGLRI